MCHTSDSRQGKRRVEIADKFCPVASCGVRVGILGDIRGMNDRSAALNYRSRFIPRGAGNVQRIVGLNCMCSEREDQSLCDAVCAMALAEDKSLDFVGQDRLCRN